MTWTMLNPDSILGSYSLFAQIRDFLASVFSCVSPSSLSVCPATTTFPVLIPILLAEEPQTSSPFSSSSGINLLYEQRLPPLCFAYRPSCWTILLDPHPPFSAEVAFVIL